MKNKLLTLFLIFGVLFAGCTSNANAEKGLLQGNVLIGPLSPVEQPGQTATINCDAYALRKIMIYDQSGKTLIRQVDIECNVEEQYTRYRVELEPGTYLVDINHLGIDRSADVPRQVEILPGTTFKLDIEIDTGIR